MTKPIRLSESFPPDSTQNQTYLANVHKTLKETLSTPFQMEYLTLRTLKSRKELEELQLLHKEWFPINYTSEYFEAILKKKSECIVAEYKVTKSNRVSERVLVGCILYDIRPAHSKYMAFSVKDYFKPLKSLYIMTIGVINEFRKHGIASFLVKHAIERTQESERNTLKYVYLHVVEYNYAAQHFYDKNKFVLVKTKRKHYHIEGKYYDAHVYILFLNGARKPLSKMEKLALCIDKINIFKYATNFMKWVCGWCLKKRREYRGVDG